MVKTTTTSKPTKRVRWEKARWEIDLAQYFNQYKHHLAVYLFLRSPDIIKHLLSNEQLNKVQQTYAKIVWEAIEFLLPDNLDDAKVLNKATFYETVDKICNLLDYCIEKQLEALSCLKEVQS